ncbi:MAG: hypothetical protein QOJ35_3947 [Solirubrobacteraceae bacterium]|jgi:hypothetical protein|nr:hypothetical protein [Solirubrobacteraceae bacterium]
MTFPPIAHAGHWIASLLYLVPLAVVVGMLTVSSIRDRRAEAAEGGPPPPDAAPEDQAAP